MARLDPHSYNDSAQPEVAHLDWKARVDFDERRLHCEALLTLKEPGAGALEPNRSAEGRSSSGPLVRGLEPNRSAEGRSSSGPLVRGLEPNRSAEGRSPSGPLVRGLDLDTRDLEIGGVFDSEGRPLRHTLHPPEPILGRRLSLELPAGTSAVRIVYRTSPEASALQWLTPAQTAGRRHPFLFSQCQAIHARSVVPLQDTPRVRVRFQAELNVPRALKALMAASFVRRVEEGERAVELYQMPQPIPPYLFALAVGELASRELGPRSRVWAEPSVVEQAAWEFAGVDRMLTAAEGLFGPYVWDRFDVLTMPPSFPYGGMENPRLTFLTPTLLAGDRSLVNVVAHELAHSWTGNLVTNANGDHFWLNEGWTVFAERRILEVLEGPDGAALQAALGRRQLEKAVARFADRPALTRLRTDLRGVDPDDAYSEVPYEKGYLFLRALEEGVGRQAFDRFLRRYVATFSFQSITTEVFTAFAREELPGALEKVGAAEWLEGTGIPKNAPVPVSARLEALAKLGAEPPSDALARTWTPTEWSLYLESLPRPLPEASCQELERRFGLTRSENFEILVSWLTLAAESGYAPVLPRIEEVLGRVGRMKYLKPLYTALAAAPGSRLLARQCFDKHRDGYHPIGRSAVEAILARYSNA
jgi:hypothetical protein